MDARERIAEVYERGLEDEGASLDPTERELYLIQDFIFEHEMAGLSGYLFNRLPDVDRIRATAEAMHRQGLKRLADMLDEALGLFRKYDESRPETTWSEILREYDPNDRLDELEEEIGKLNDYGLGESKIA
jgi:Domain of unknown function (DUF4375)